MKTTKTTAKNLKAGDTYSVASPSDSCAETFRVRQIGNPRKMKGNGGRWVYLVEGTQDSDHGIESFALWTHDRINLHN